VILLIIEEFIESIQSNIEKIYDFTTGVKASDFLVDEKIRHKIDASYFESIIDEEYIDNNINGNDIKDIIIGSILINEQEDDFTRDYMGTFLGMYFSDEVIDTITENNPMQVLGNRNYLAFQTVLEETSHLLYTMHALKFSKPCSILELELQAYVDSFILTILHLQKMAGHVHMGYLTPYISEDAEFLPYLCEESKQRYEIVSRTCPLYCKYLYDSHIKKLEKNRFKREIIDFYSKSQAGKLQRIQDLRNI